MKESYRKGIANHPDPESCESGRKAALEALTGAYAGWVSSSEIGYFRVPTVSENWKATLRSVANARPAQALRSRRPQACIEALCARTGEGRLEKGDEP